MGSGSACLLLKQLPNLFDNSEYRNLLIWERVRKENSGHSLERSAILEGDQDTKCSKTRLVFVEIIERVKIT